MERVQAPGGELWLAEPGQFVAGRFVAALHQHGWTGSSKDCLSPWSDSLPGTTYVATVHRLRWQGA